MGHDAASGSSGNRVTQPTHFKVALAAMDDALASGLWAQAAELSDVLSAHATEATPAELERATRLVRRAEQWMRRQQNGLVEAMRETQSDGGDLPPRGQLVDVRA